MNFYNKYLKYKNKYLNLKKQQGGSDNYYLPCDITHYTKELYYNKNFMNELNNGNIYQHINIPLVATKSTARYKQDLYIELYDNINEKYYNIYNGSVLDENDIIFTNEYKYFKCDKEEVLEIKKINDICDICEQSKGGNFIAGPEIGMENNQTIFCIKGYSDVILTKFKEFGYEKYEDKTETETKTKTKANKLIIELECSFKANGFRHIDELMCFMPYGKGKFKVWFYDEFTESDNLTPPEYKKLWEELFKKNDKGSKDWFDEKLSLGKKLPEMKKKYIELLNKERKENLNNISKRLFGAEYSEENKLNFIFLKFYINKPSLLNRSYIEKNGENPIIIFPKLSLASQPENFAIIEKEIEEIKSYITEKKPKIEYINVKNANEEKPEGGPHCLIKQRFSK